jgi:hypothetical protein
VAAFGSEPPKVDLNLREGVQSPELVSANVVVKVGSRVACEHKARKCGQVVQGIWLDEAEDEWRGRNGLVRRERLPGEAHIRKRSESRVQARRAERVKLLAC